MFIPREHGATAMLLTPFLAAAILLRDVYWPEFVALVAVVGAFAIKDPLVVLARQRFVWKQQHDETREAKRAVVTLAALLLSSGAVLMLAGDWRQLIPLALGAAAFTTLAITVNVLNKQRSEWFQVASAAALSATCLVACLSATGSIPEWGWFLWMLCALQAAAGIFVVHARLDARIAARKNSMPPAQSRHAAFIAVGVVILAAFLFLVLERLWVAGALMLTGACFLAELWRQKQPASLQMPLQRVGLQALAQSTVYTAVLVIGLWP